MISLTVYYNNDISTDRKDAIATAKMIEYAANDTANLGLGECSQLLLFVSDMIKMKFNIREKALQEDIETYRKSYVLDHLSERDKKMN